jgi:predicted Zn-dependent protease
MDPGERGLGEMVASIDHGLLVDGVLGTGPGQYHERGLLQLGGAGFLIEAAKSWAASKMWRSPAISIKIYAPSRP